MKRLLLSCVLLSGCVPTVDKAGDEAIAHGRAKAAIEVAYAIATNPPEPTPAPQPGPAKCKSCDGSGWTGDRAAIWIPCPECNKDGKKPKPSQEKQPPPPRPIVVKVRPDSPSRPTGNAQRPTDDAKSTAANLEDGAGGAGDKCDLPGKTADVDTSVKTPGFSPKSAKTPGNNATSTSENGLGNPGRQGSKDAPLVKSPAVVIKHPLPVKFHYELRQQRICTPQGCRIVQQWVKVYDQ